MSAVRLSVLVSIASVLSCWLNAAYAQNADSPGWKQWRGPNRDGKASKTEWGDSLDDRQLKQVWRVPLGPSYSGPIVTEDRVYTTETKDRRQEVIRALDRKTGEQIWETAWDGAMKVPFFANSNGSWIRATPVLDGERLFVAGMTDVLVCLNASNGDELWRLDFERRVGSKDPSFGLVCSPIVVGDHIFIQAGGGFTKVEKATGSIVWQSLKEPGGMYGGSFSSPVLATVAGKQQFVVQTRKELCGVDPKSGAVLWKQPVPAFRGMNILTPVVLGDTIFTSSYKNGSFLYRIVRDGEKFGVSQLWKTKTSGYMSSPVEIDGHIYMHLQNQRFTCIDLANGKTKWTSEPFGKYWSIVADGNRILALDERGELLLIDANPDALKLLSRRRISSESTWAHIGVEGKQIFVRELGAMTVWETVR